ncbi:sodium/bile acid cotransporter 7-like [Rhodnius prolixus]
MVVEYHHKNINELIKRNWFLCGVLLCILFAEMYPSLGATGGVLQPEWSVKYGAVGVIFFISGLSLRLDDISAAARSYKLHLFIQLFTFLCIPIMVQILSALLWFLLGINEWILKGLITVSCMPPPVSSAIIITKAIGGNEAAAVFNSIIGSFIGIFITPVSLLFFLGSTALLPMINSVIILSQTVLLPLGIGLMLRHFSIVQVSRLPHLGSVSQALLLFIIYTTFCDAFITHDTPMNASDILITIVLVLVIQIGLLYISFHSSQRTKWYNASDVVAITFCSTHKSLTLGIPILRILFSGYSHFSQITMPLLVYHPTQIILGGLLVPPFKKWLTYNRSKIKIMP